MMTFITSCLVPGKLACENCIRSEPLALKERDWQSVKFYVYNRIVAYKREINKKEWIIRILTETAGCTKLSVYVYKENVH